MKKLKKINQILFFITIVFIIFYFGKSFLIPFIFGIYLAALMTPFSGYIEKFRINRIFSSLISTLVVFLILGGILYIFSWQMNTFLSEISSVRKAIFSLVRSMQEGISSLMNLTVEDQRDIWQSRSVSVLNSVESGLTSFLGNIISTIIGFLLVLIYTFLLLYYRDKFLESVMWFIKKGKEEKTGVVLHKISLVVYHYLWGRLKVMTILAIMYFITFMIFDIPFAGLLTIFGALVTIIPYLGPFISGVLPILFAVIYLDNIQIILLFTILIVIEQLIESYVLEPLIIGNEVKLNPLIVIVAITIGGMIWGVAGMILFVPLFAMFKIVSNNTPGLEAIGYFFGPAKQPVPRKS